VKKIDEKQQKKQSRRLTLRRETIQILNDPARLELARGGTDTTILGTSSHIWGSCEMTTVC